MLKGIDISNHNAGLNLYNTKTNFGLDFVIVKATEGLNFVDKYCDPFIEQAKKINLLWGFYHFARNNDAQKEAEFFYNNTKNYVGNGIPVLDIEAGQNAQWVENFVKKYYELAKVFPWVYCSASYSNTILSDYVAKNCGLWCAGYPQKYTNFNVGKFPYKISNKWTLAAWQFTNCLGGGNLDANIFYGSYEAWTKYAKAQTKVISTETNTQTSTGTDTKNKKIIKVGATNYFYDGTEIHKLENEKELNTILKVMENNISYITMDQKEFDSFIKILNT